VYNEEMLRLGFKQYIDNAETYVIWLEGRKYERRMMRGRC